LRRAHRGRGIENRLQCVRDVTFAEDRRAVRTEAAPRVSAAGRTLAGRPRTAIALVATTGSQVLK
jgi:hypothetical protein